MLNVALLQMIGQGYDQAANLEKGDAYCRRAAAAGADVALFPEMWNIGCHFDRTPPDDAAATEAADQHARNDDLWRAPELWGAGEPDRMERERADLERWRTQAVDRDGPFVAHFRRLTAELGMAIALTYLERWPGGPRNSASLIDRRGEIVLTYAKVHTCDFDLPEACLTPGDGFHVAELGTATGAVRVGAMICYDRECPESARALMLGGAEVILVPNSCTLDPLRRAQLQVRAFENMVGVAMANNAAPQADGHSVAFHPVAYQDGRPRDTLVIAAGETEGGVRGVLRPDRDPRLPAAGNLG